MKASCYYLNVLLLIKVGEQGRSQRVPVSNQDPGSLDWLCPFWGFWKCAFRSQPLFPAMCRRRQECADVSDTRSGAPRELSCLSQLCRLLPGTGI